MSINVDKDFEDAPRPAEKRSLISKLAVIASELGQLERTGEKKGVTASGGNFEYDVFQESDILAPVQRAFARHKIGMIPSTVALDRRDVVDQKGVVKHIVDVIVEFLIEDAETGEQRTGRAAGSAEERGDGSATSKAQTDACKTHLRKLLLLTAKQSPKTTSRPSVSKTTSPRPATSGITAAKVDTQTVIGHVLNVTEDFGKRTKRVFFWAEFIIAGGAGTAEKGIVEDQALFDLIKTVAGHDAEISLRRDPAMTYPRITGIRAPSK